MDSSYLLKKLHSLTGVFPLTLFILEHFTVNSFLRQGQQEFDSVVGLLHRLPYLWSLELLIFAGFLFHAGYGLYIIFTGKNNVNRYSYIRNWLFLLQRITAVMILIFLLFHVYTLRFSGLVINYITVTQVLSQNWTVLLLAVGVVAAVLHLANGLSTFMISWGITIGLKSQRFFGYVSLFIFWALVLAGINILKL